jgi:D-tyrosyl-tRNA(Tyr) deacylase
VADRPAREQLILIATDPNAWPYQEQIEALLDTHEREIREQVAQEIEQATVTVDGGTYPMQTARAVEQTLTTAARIARGNTTEETS